MDQLDDCIIPAELMRAWGWKENLKEQKQKISDGRNTQIW